MITKYARLKQKYDALMDYHIDMIKMNKRLIDENRALRAMIGPGAMAIAGA